MVASQTGFPHGKVGGRCVIDGAEGRQRHAARNAFPSIATGRRRAEPAGSFRPLTGARTLRPLEGWRAVGIGAPVPREHEAAIGEHDHRRRASPQGLHLPGSMTRRNRGDPGARLSGPDEDDAAIPVQQLVLGRRADSSTANRPGRSSGEIHHCESAAPPIGDQDAPVRQLTHRSQARELLGKLACRR